MSISGTLSLRTWQFSLLQRYIWLAVLCFIIYVEMSVLRKTYPSIDQVLESEQACPQYQHQVDVEAVDAHLCHVFGVRDLLHLDARICGEFRQMLLLEDFFLDFF